jgi:hypothetical protein
VVLIDKPKFIKDTRYFFDVDSETIHGLHEGSFSYYHEISHYNDHKNELYKSISIYVSACMQIMALIFPIFIFLNIKIWLNAYAILSIFILQEEIRAYIFAYRSIKIKEVNKNVRKRA